jgi:ABC-type Na+ efflux pump permease subunit
MPPRHHLNDAIRELFLTGAIVALLASSFSGARLPQQSVSLVVVIILLAVLAGFINPKGNWKFGVKEH